MVVIIGSKGTIAVEASKRVVILRAFTWAIPMIVSNRFVKGGLIY